MMAELNPSLPPIWTKEECKKLLTDERVSGRKTKDQFWDKLFKWHKRQYVAAGNDLEKCDRADACLDAVRDAENEMGLNDDPITLHRAKAVFEPILEVKKRSIFEGIK